MDTVEEQKLAEESSLTKPFSFDFVDENKSCRFHTNVAIPADVRNVNEFTKRIVNYHDLPLHLEEDLLNALQVFMRKENEAYYNDLADQTLETHFSNPQFSESAIDSWNEAFTQECSRYSDAKEVKTEELTFSEMYHSLIHSPALETLLQLENTYALAVQDLLAQRDNALKKLEQKQNEEMEAALEPGDNGSSDNYHDFVNNLAARHCEDTQMITTQWSSSLSDLQEAQKREYQEWVSKVYEDLVKTDSKDSGGSFERARSPSTVSLLPDDVTPHHPRLEESFTIHLGAQMKSTHNLRLMCGDLLDLCRYKPAKPGSSVWAQPQRIQTAMSLYSQSLSGLVLLVDNRINSYSGIKKEFASICQQSTDFHFPDLDKQFCMIQQNLEVRRKKKLQKSNGVRETRNDEAFKTSTIEAGNFYITRHSNLSQVHVVFHLVVDDTLKSPDLATRNAIVSGLRNILHTASRQNVHTITLPVLLAEEMTEDMTVTWCTRRAELVLKCVKGFMMECASWSGSESFNIQFVLPKDISSDMFHTLSNMLPSIFRVSRTLDLQDLSRN